MNRLLRSAGGDKSITSTDSTTGTNKKTNVLLVAVKDDMFKTDYTKYLDEVENQYDSHLFVFGTESREVSFNDEGFINEVRGGIGGEMLSDQEDRFYAENEEFQSKLDELMDEYDEDGEYYSESEEAPSLEGGTEEDYALYDAISNVITTTLRRCDDVMDDVTITIVTDRAVDFGSVDKSRSDIQELISQFQNEFGWRFNFLCSEKTAYDEALKLGINPSRSANYSTSEEAVNTLCQMLS
tara:strand:- start:1102 stop:1821 length:720 start_codon:yes stop_codon:yes gene_type:complete